MSPNIACTTTLARVQVMSAASPNIKEVEAGGTSVTSVPSSLLFPLSPSPHSSALQSLACKSLALDHSLASGSHTSQGPACSLPHDLAARHERSDACMDGVDQDMPAAPFAALSFLQLPFALRARLTASGIAAACAQHRPGLRLSFSG
eukprot:1160605-Pelagomonas_calceolata.AAC.7